MKVVLATLVGTVLLLAGAHGRAPALAAPAVSLPFSTTYDCAEQAQGTSGWVSCDGIASDGDWKTSNGKGEQITSAANYPGGGGGRGQRHWIGQSSGNTNGSGGLRFSFSTQQEVYVRWYVRWQAGLKLGGNAQPIARNHKVIYFSGSGCGQSGGCYFDLKGSSFAFVVNGHPYDGGSGWDGLFGGSNAQSDGRWMLMEVRLKNSTGGSANGIAQWWVDGTLKFSATNINMSGSNGFSDFELPSNHQFTTVSGSCCDMYQDFDDVAISATGPIGPVGGGGNPAPVPPPAAPYNVRIVR